MSDDNDLEPVPGGFRTRLRYGKGLRGRFVIAASDRDVAARRRDVLRDLSNALTASGHSATSGLILKQAAAEVSDKDFEEAVRVAQSLCARAGKAPKKSQELTFQDLADQWSDGRLAKKHPDHVNEKKTADMDAARLAVICDVIIAPGLKFGALPLSSVTLDHCETVMQNLPKTTKRPATRRQYAQLMHRVLELAVFPCRVLKASPLPRGFMPRIGKPPAFPYLYPREDAALLAWTPERAAAEGAGPEHPGIPLCRRMLWGFLAREGCRSGEAVTLRVGVDVDLEHGSVRLDKNKTGDARAWALDPGVAEALRGYVKLRKAKRGDPLFVDEAGKAVDNEKLAEQLRADLVAAGIERAELITDGENTRKMRAHDLRGTFVTLSLANGKTETWVADRTGHTTSTMINKYRRAARTAAELGLGSLAPLNDALPEFSEIRQGGPEGGPAVSENDSGSTAASQNPEQSQLVPKVRLELTLPFGKRILSPPRLPVPPLRLFFG